MRREKMAVLDVRNLTMSFADKKLYEDASFQLEKHEHMGIVGQNGAGKSTLIKILIGKELPVEGDIKWQKKHQDRLFGSIRRYSTWDDADSVSAYGFSRAL
jgi:ATPase subunit of ABC transporter with duplicated ATPase domains